MGQGIVSTPNDFGKNGSGPSHPELLDDLACRLIQGGWRLKPLHKLILLSRTYRFATTHPRFKQHAEIDAQNRWLWRGNYRRLEAETIRDALLFVSGRLRLDRGGPGFYEELPKELGRTFPFFNWEPSRESERRKRSIYMFQRRNLVVPMLEAYDAADMTQSCERRSSSVTTSQALALLNGKLANECAASFAQRVLLEAGLDPADGARRAFWLAFGRAPSQTELAACTDHVTAGIAAYRRDLGASLGKEVLLEPELRAWTDVCLVLLNANEFLYLE
jgi:hypothetical protein